MNDITNYYDITNSGIMTSLKEKIQSTFAVERVTLRKDLEGAHQKALDDLRVSLGISWEERREEGRGGEGRRGEERRGEERRGEERRGEERREESRGEGRRGEGRGGTT